MIARLSGHRMGRRGPVRLPCRAKLRHLICIGYRVAHDEVLRLAAHTSATICPHKGIVGGT